MIWHRVIRATLRESKLKNGKPAPSLHGKHTHKLPNPTGKFRTRAVEAVAEGALGVTTADLNNDLSELGNLHHTCMTKAQEFEEET